MFFLYVISHIDDNNDFVAPTKIGVTNNLRRRLSEIQTGNPNKIDLYASIPFSFEELAYTAERFFHEFEESSSLRGEWFDIEPQYIFDSYFSNTESEKTTRTQSFEYIEELKWKINALEIILSEQEFILEDLFRSKLKDRNDKVFDDYNVTMCKKYKKTLALVDGIKSGKNQDGILWHKPYWCYLAEQ